MGVGVPASQVEIPVLGSPQIPQPGTPTPHDSDALLPPASPDASVPRIQQPSPSPLRTITPTSATEHPLASGSGSNADARGFLSPPTRSPPRANKRRTRPPPAPTPLDLPTRADVQAMSAIAMAEDSGLRGGWVMKLDPSGNARRGAAAAGRRSGEMVDVDLEGGRGDATHWRAEMERQREEEKLAMAGVEHRRPSPNLLGRDSVSGSVAGSGYRSPSPLSRSTSPAGSMSNSRSPSLSLDPMDATPRAVQRDDPMAALPGVVEATNRLRRPPPIKNGAVSPGLGMGEEWEGGAGQGGRDRESQVIRSRPNSLAMYGHAPRVQREASTTSLNSEAGLLRGSSQIFDPAEREGNGGNGRPDRSTTATPPIVYSSPVTSPSRIGVEKEGGGREGLGGVGLGGERGGGGVEDLMEEISLDDKAGVRAGVGA
jgi:hypothetical protein